MSSYADVHFGHRRSRYYAPPVPRRKAARIKFGRILAVLGILMVAFVQAAYGGGRTGTETVTVQPGQTLWSIAAERYPDDDTRGRVGEIVQLNHLGADPIYGGERLSVPAR
jgi:nucleoid-associated protein YgaU